MSGVYMPARPVCNVCVPASLCFASIFYIRVVYFSSCVHVCIVLSYAAVQLVCPTSVCLPICLSGCFEFVCLVVCPPFRSFSLVSGFSFSVSFLFLCFPLLFFYPFLLPSFCASFAVILPVSRGFQTFLFTLRSRDGLQCAFLSLPVYFGIAPRNANHSILSTLVSIAVAPSCFG